MNDALNRVFGGLAALFWLLCLGAVGWQLWDFFSQGAWHWITVGAMSERLFGPLTNVTNESLQIIIAILSSFSLMFFFGILAMAFSGLAKAFD